MGLRRTKDMFPSMNIHDFAPPFFLSFFFLLLPLLDGCFEHVYHFFRTQRYVLCSRSIVHPSLPPHKDYVRQEMLPSGFMLRPLGDGSGSTHLTFTLQLKSSAADFALSDLNGRTSLLLDNYARLLQVLEKAHGAE